jgi:hypothetical protein
MESVLVLGLDLWKTLGTGFLFFWAALIMMLTTAFAFLFAHAIIPSLVATGHVPAGVAKLRVLFYLTAIGAFLLALFLYYNVLQHVTIVYEPFPRRWL